MRTLLISSLDNLGKIPTSGENSQRSYQTVSVLMYPESILKGNIYSKKMSKLASPSVHLSARNEPISKTSRGKKSNKIKRKRSDKNPLKNKALSSRNNGKSEAGATKAGQVLDQKVTDYQQEENTEILVDNPDTEEEDKVHSQLENTGEISSIDEDKVTAQIKANPVRTNTLEEEAYDIIAEQEYYRGMKIVN